MLEAYWQDFLKQNGLPETTRYHDAFAFGSGEAMANELLALVLGGQKKATTSALASFAFEGLPPPAVGDYAIVTNFAGISQCIIQTTAATTLPFSAVSWEMAQREGEDENLESWREGHTRFFTHCGQQEGFTFSPELPVVFEDFEVVWPLP